jgi:hypothetical protein
MLARCCFGACLQQMVLGLGYLGGSTGAAESWAQRLGLDQQVSKVGYHLFS